MSLYAVLGATGNVGTSLLEVLLQSPDRRINAYVRSKSKLFQNQPRIASNERVRTFEGSLDDSDLLADCMFGARAVFLAVALNANQPGCTVAQDTAHSVIKALKKLRETNPQSKMPKLVVLSSASTNEKMCRDMPPLAHAIMYRAAYHIYIDLEKAEKFLKAQEDWVTSVFIKPGGLVNDKQGGHELSTERQQTFLSYLDLAGGMVEVAESEGDQWDMKDVSVLPLAKDVKIEWRVPLFVLLGLLCYYFPGVYPYLTGW